MAKKPAHLDSCLKHYTNYIKAIGNNQLTNAQSAKDLLSHEMQQEINHRKSKRKTENKAKGFKFTD